MARNKGRWNQKDEYQIEFMLGLKWPGRFQPLTCSKDSDPSWSQISFQMFSWSPYVISKWVPLTFSIHRLSLIDSKSHSLGSALYSWKVCGHLMPAQCKTINMLGEKCQWLNDKPPMFKSAALPRLKTSKNNTKTNEMSKDPSRDLLGVKLLSQLLDNLTRHQSCQGLKPCLS